MDAGRELDVRVAHLVMGQKVTWLRNWMRREPWLLDDAFFADSIGPTTEGWVRGITDEDWEIYHRGGTLVARYSTDWAHIKTITERMHELGFWCQMRTPSGVNKLNDGFWAGFTPHGTSGWNGKPDKWQSCATLPHAVCLAAIAAITAKDEEDSQEVVHGA